MKFAAMRRDTADGFVNPIKKWNLTSVNVEPILPKTTASPNKRLLAASQRQKFSLTGLSRHANNNGYFHNLVF